jgi:hypothetical protein
MSSRNMCLLPRATLHSDSKQYSTLKHVVLLPCHHGKVYSVRLVSFVTQTRISIYANPMLQLNCCSERNIESLARFGKPCNVNKVRYVNVIEPTL